MLRHFWRSVSQLLGGGDTVFNSFLCEVLVTFRKVLTLVRVRLKLEVLGSSKLLENDTNLRAKVRVWLKLECGLI